jgi:ABC-2 type transport system ATP-binding protein
VPETAISFESTTKRYRSGTLALHEATWSIPVGARSCLLGPNGSGKTTSIRLLEGALMPTHGRVSLMGIEVNRPGYAQARQRVGVVPQNAGMYSDLTTAEYLELARRVFGRGNVDHAVESFGLGEHRAKRLAQLSGGFQRRVVLAAALLAEPDVLLLDEPTVGLDPVAAHEVHAYLVDAMRGRTTLLCTHNLAEAEALCDDVVILKKGEVLLHESLASLRQRHKPRARIAASQGVDALTAALRSRGLEPLLLDGNVLVEIDAQKDGPALLRALLADGIDVHEFTPITTSLEDVFLEAVQR